MKNILKNLILFFLKKYPQIDSYIPFEGESPIIELVGKCLEINSVEKEKLKLI